jgi:hypothetical protein
MAAKRKAVKKKIVGLTADIKLLGSKGSKTVVGRVDTGAEKSSVDLKLAAEVGLGTLVKTTIIKSAHGSTHRPVIRGKIIFAGKKMNAYFTVADRGHMKYRVLVGQNILKRGFLIDPSLK